MFDDLKIVPEMSGFRHDDFYTSHALGTYSVNILRTISEKKKRTITDVYNNCARKLSSPSLILRN